MAAAEYTKKEKDILEEEMEGVVKAVAGRLDPGDDAVITGVSLPLVCNRGVEHDPRIQTSKLLRHVFSVSCRYLVLRVLFISFNAFLCVMGRHGVQGPPAAPV